MPRAKLTKATVASAVYGGEEIATKAGGPGWSRWVIWDTEVSGLGLRVFPTGRKAFILSYRAGRKKRLLTLGDAAILTPNLARERARRYLVDVLDGRDPLAERREAEAAGLTVADLVERYAAEHLPKKKASSAAEDRRQLDKTILPALGSLPILEVEREHVGRLHHEMRETPTGANRALALLSKLFSLAERWGLRPTGSNPCAGIERYREQKRERFLSASELARLGEVLSEVERVGSESPSAVALIRLLILTGCRKGEILGLTWGEVDFERSCLRLEDSKTGRKVVPLGAPALAILAGLPREAGNPHVLPGWRKGQALGNPDQPWRRIRSRAGLDGVRLHDLRHTYAATGAGAGLGLPVVGALLGHADAKTTSRYAHVADDPARRAAEQISSELAAALEGKANGEIIKMRSADRRL